MSKTLAQTAAVIGGSISLACASFPPSDFRDVDGRTVLDVPNRIEAKIRTKEQRREGSRISVERARIEAPASERGPAVIVDTRKCVLVNQDVSAAARVGIGGCAKNPLSAKDDLKESDTEKSENNEVRVGVTIDFD